MGVATEYICYKRIVFDDHAVTLLETIGEKREFFLVQVSNDFDQVLKNGVSLVSAGQHQLLVLRLSSRIRLEMDDRSDQFE